MTLANLLLPGRDPDAQTRTRRVLDRLAAIVDALLLDETLFQDGVQSWGLIGLLYTGQGAPASTLGYVGDYYLDLSDGTLYKRE